MEAFLGEKASAIQYGERRGPADRTLDLVEALWTAQVRLLARLEMRRACGGSLTSRHTNLLAPSPAPTHPRHRP